MAGERHLTKLDEVIGGCKLFIISRNACYYQFIINSVENPLKVLAISGFEFDTWQEARTAGRKKVGELN